MSLREIIAYKLMNLVGFVGGKQWRLDMIKIAKESVLYKDKVTRPAPKLSDKWIQARELNG